MDTTKKYPGVTIEVAANGFVVHEKLPDMRREIASVARPFVFETFQALSTWLENRLEKPAEPRAGNGT